MVGYRTDKKNLKLLYFWILNKELQKWESQMKTYFSVNAKYNITLNFPVLLMFLVELPERQTGILECFFLFCTRSYLIKSQLIKAELLLRWLKFFSRSEYTILHLLHSKNKVKFTITQHLFIPIKNYFLKTVRCLLCV